jgi:glycosyltransferase involved in cell wall biosynthesis
VKAAGARRIRLMGECCVDDMALAAMDTSEGHDHTVQFASIARLLHWKGIHLGIEAFARLGNVQARYLIMGGGPELPRLKALAERLGVSGRVTFMEDSSRPEMLTLLRHCDALVHPCLANSGSMISLEAMAGGKPVICLDLGGIKLQVTDETGFRVRADTPERAISGLARAMKTVVEDRSGVRQMGLKARERVERNFTWAHRGSSLTEVYADILNGQPATIDAVASSVAPITKASTKTSQALNTSTSYSL